jgi:Tfp pilus assembly protein PilO
MSKGQDPRIFLGLAALALVVGGFLVYSQYNGVTAKQEEVDKLTVEVQKAATLGRDLEASNKRLGDLKVKLAHLERGVQDYQYVPTLLKELEQVGNANGIQVLGIRPTIKQASTAPDEKQIRKAYDELTIEVKGRGSYGAVLKFLQGLQRFPKVVAARTLSLTPKQEAVSKPGSPGLDMVVELKVFVFPDAKPEAKNGQDSAVAASEVPSNG